MLLKNDVIIITVNQLIADEVASCSFIDYNSALEFALKQPRTCYINLKARNFDGSSSYSASIAKVKSGQIELIHEWLLNQLITQKAG